MIICLVCRLVEWKLGSKLRNLFTLVQMNLCRSNKCAATVHWAESSDVVLHSKRSASKRRLRVLYSKLGTYEYILNVFINCLT